MHDNAYLQLMSRLFESIKREVESAIARGENPDQASKTIKLEELEKLFVGNSRMRRLIFANYVLGGGVAAAFTDATTKK